MLGIRAVHLACGSGPRLATLPHLDLAQILVLAPHPDDESIGCGGSLAAAVQRGSRVVVAFMTDGEACQRPASVSAEAIAQQRRSEARAALAVLGVELAGFLALPDQGLATAPQASDQVATFLARYQPEAVLIPFFWDVHPDHLALSSILLAALKRRTPHASPLIVAYQVQCPITPLLANCAVDISPTFPLKAKALEAYVSQRYLFPALLSLNRQEGRALGCTAAELFVSLSAARYERAFQWFTSLGSRPPIRALGSHRDILAAYISGALAQRSLAKRIDAAAGLPVPSYATKADRNATLCK